MFCTEILDVEKLDQYFGCVTPTNKTNGIFSGLVRDLQEIFEIKKKFGARCVGSYQAVEHSARAPPP